MKGVGSQEGEESQEQPGHSEEIERPELPPARSPEDRYGSFIMPQFPGKEYLKLREWVFNLRTAIPASERRDNPNIPQSVEEANALGMVSFAEFIATESHHDFMIAFPNVTGTDLDHDEFHAMKLVCKRIMDENQHIHISTFEEEDNPKSPKDPKNKKEIEHMTPENKQLILEIDNSSLIDCTVQWLNMLDKDLQQEIVDRVSNVVKAKEEAEEEHVRDHEITKEPVVPPATKVSIETQTDPHPESEESGSSHQREEPASPVGSQQREGAEEQKKDINADGTAPEKKPVTLDYYGQDIAGI